MIVQGSSGDTVFLLMAEDEVECEWIERNLDEGDWNPDYPDKIIVGHRYIEDILQGVSDAGFTLRRRGS